MALVTDGQGLLQLLHLGLEGAYALGQAKNDLDAGEVDSKVVDEAPYLLRPPNIVHRVKADAALGPRRDDQALSLVGPEGLGVDTQ